MAVQHLCLGMAGFEGALLLPQFRRETSGGSEQFRIRRIRDRNPMARGAGRRPGAADRGVRSEPVVEAVIDRSMHDHQDRHEHDHDQGAERARHPRKPPQDKRSLARRVEENLLTDHGRVEPSGLRSA